MIFKNAHPLKVSSLYFAFHQHFDDNRISDSHSNSMCACGYFYIILITFSQHVHFVNNKFYFNFQAAKKFAFMCLITACMWLTVSFREQLKMELLHFSMSPWLCFNIPNFTCICTIFMVVFVCSKSLFRTYRNKLYAIVITFT